MRADKPPGRDLQKLGCSCFAPVRVRDLGVPRYVERARMLRSTRTALAQAIRRDHDPGPQGTPFVLEFLRYLEQDRHNAIRRNRGGLGRTEPRHRTGQSGRDGDTCRQRRTITVSVHRGLMRRSAHFREELISRSTLPPECPPKFIPAKEHKKTYAAKNDEKVNHPCSPSEKNRYSTRRHRSISIQRLFVC